MHKLIVAFILLILSQVQPCKAEVPEKMFFCEMELTIDADARAYIQGVIDKLKMNPARFKLLVDRAHTYMPFVEEAFELGGLPSDLKFIVLQESALQSDAVSTSNAVGFWQFKEPTAIEAGLIVTEYIDERKHIFRSSVAAAKYFWRLNKDFDNWIYSIIGYNRGPTGALPYVKREYFGKDEMPIDMEIHWYALKAIAHKLAFEEELEKEATPSVWLEPKSNHGIASLETLAILSGVEKQQLIDFNKWVTGEELPDGRYFTYYVPHENSEITTSLSDPLKDLSFERRDSVAIAVVKETPIHTSPQEPAKEIVSDAAHSPDLKFQLMKPEEDPDYGVCYILTKPGVSLIEEAVKAKIRAFRLLEWNNIQPEEIVRPGTFIRLTPAKKAKYHIVRKNEYISSIAAEYHLDEAKLARLNRNNEFGPQLYAGQKLYLKSQKPAGEKIILIEIPGKKKKSENPITEPVKKASPEPEIKVESPPAPDYRLPEYDTKEITHTVAKGETLWSISRTYGTTVEVIKMMNKLNSTNLLVGQKIQVLQRIEKK